jgi:hypothetical protein
MLLGVGDYHFCQHRQLERPAHFRGMGVKITPTLEAPFVVRPHPVPYAVDVAANFTVNRLPPSRQVLGRLEETGLGAIVKGAKIVDCFLDSDVVFERN